MDKGALFYHIQMRTLGLDGCAWDRLAEDLKDLIGFPIVRSVMRLSKWR